MSDLDRRNFLKLGVGGAAGLALGEKLAFGAPVLTGLTGAADGRLNEAFLMEPGLYNRLDLHTGQITESTLWALTKKTSYSTSDLLAPVAFDLDRIEQEVQPDDDPISALLNLPITGGPNLSDLIAKSLDSVRDRKLDLGLHFLVDSSLRHQVSMADGIPMISAESSPARILSPDDDLDFATDAAVRLPLFKGNGWLIQLRGPEQGSFGTCVRSRIWHFNIDVMYSRDGRRYDYVRNYHLGAYREGGRLCFVMWQNEGRETCWKTCTPTWSELKALYSRMITAAAAVAGVSIAAWLVATIAAAAATATLPLLVVL